MIFFVVVYVYVFVLFSACINEFYNGGCFKSNTKSSGSVSIAHTYLTILGFIQPEVLGVLMGQGKLHGDGFWERFMFVIHSGT
jgi:hypothetical protein